MIIEVEPGEAGPEDAYCLVSDVLDVLHKKLGNKMPFFVLDVLPMYCPYASVLADPIIEQSSYVKGKVLRDMVEMYTMAYRRKEALEDEDFEL